MRSEYETSLEMYKTWELTGPGEGGMNVKNDSQCSRWEIV